MCISAILIDICVFCSHFLVICCGLVLECFTFILQGHFTGIVALHY